MDGKFNNIFARVAFRRSENKGNSFVYGLSAENYLAEFRAVALNGSQFGAVCRGKTLAAVSIALSPLILITPIPPAAFPVATAAIVLPLYHLRI